MVIEFTAPALLAAAPMAVVAATGVALAGLGAAYLYTHPEVREEIADSAQSAWATLETMATQAMNPRPIVHMNEKKPPSEGAGNTPESGREIDSHTDPDGPAGDTLDEDFGTLVGVAASIFGALKDVLNKKN